MHSAQKIVLEMLSACEKMTAHQLCAGDKGRMLRISNVFIHLTALEEKRLVCSTQSSGAIGLLPKQYFMITDAGRAALPAQQLGDTTA